MLSDTGDSPDYKHEGDLEEHYTHHGSPTAIVEIIFECLSAVLRLIRAQLRKFIKRNGCRMLKVYLTFFVILINLPAIAATEEELKEVMAAMINLNGQLCAKVVEVRPLRIANQYEVTCIEYRGGSGAVRYILNAKTGEAFKGG